MINKKITKEYLLNNNFYEGGNSYFILDLNNDIYIATDLTEWYVGRNDDQGELLVSDNIKDSEKLKHLILGLK